MNYLDLMKESARTGKSIQRILEEIEKEENDERG